MYEEIAEKQKKDVLRIEVDKKIDDRRK